MNDWEDASNTQGVRRIELFGTGANKGRLGLPIWFKFHKRLAHGVCNNKLNARGALLESFAANRVQSSAVSGLDRKSVV